MAVKSYAWNKRLDAEVADTQTVDIPTPGFNGPENYQTDATEVVVDGNVIPSANTEEQWAEDFSSVTVTNNTGSSWAAGQTVYVTVPGKAVNSDDIQGSMEALEARVTAAEAAIVQQAGQIDANTSAIAALDARVSALENAGAVTTTPHGPDPEEKDHDDRAKRNEEQSRHKGNPKKK